MAATIQDETELDSRQRRGRERNVIRAFVLLVAIVLMVTNSHESWLPTLIPAMSPLTTIASLLTTRQLLVTSWLGLAVAFVVLIRRRWFCHWVCPTGACADCLSWAGRQFGRRCPRAPAVGNWILLMTVGGSLLGVPLLLWLDPLALFGGMFGIVDVETIPTPRWAAIGMGLVLLVSLLWPSMWCSRLCPLGAFQDLIYRVPRTLRQTGQLQGMVSARPDSVTHATGADSHPSALASHTPSDDERRSSGLQLTRRTVFGMGLGAMAALATRRLSASQRTCLRPPRSADEDCFIHLCIRCGNCLRACPTNIIRPDHGDSGVFGLLTPKLQYDEDYCEEGCTQCTLVCPSGALMPIANPADKVQAVIGHPKVDMQICILGDDRECSKCRNWCPYEAISLQFSEEEYTLVPQIDLSKCPGCGACEYACPTTPDKAIVVEPLPTPDN
jgi:ferredoxin-type protein NapF